MYKIESKTKLPDTDAAGILFFAGYFKLAHEAFESFMDSIDFSLNYIIDQADFMVLIAHAESDYKSSLRLGDKYELILRVEKLGRTSFVLAYEFTNGKGDLTAALKTVHVAVSKESQKPVSLPQSLRDPLAEHT